MTNPKVVAAHRARSTRKRSEPDRMIAGASVFGDVRAERALAMADARNVVKAVAASLSPASKAKQAPAHEPRAGRPRDAPLRFVAVATVPGDCENERRLVAALSASKHQARPSGRRPPRAAASKTGSSSARRGSATPQGGTRQSKRHRATSGSRYSACPCCGKQVAMVMMNHHIDSYECDRSLTVPHEVD